MKHLTRLVILAAIALAPSTTNAQFDCVAPDVMVDGQCSCGGATQGPPCRMAQLRADVVATVEGSIA